MKNYVVVYTNGVRTIPAIDMRQALQKFYAQVGPAKIVEVLAA